MPMFSVETRRYRSLSAAPDETTPVTGVLPMGQIDSVGVAARHRGEAGLAARASVQTTPTGQAVRPTPAPLMDSSCTLRAEMERDRPVAR